MIQTWFIFVYLDFVKKVLYCFCPLLQCSFCY